MSPLLSSCLPKLSPTSSLPRLGSRAKNEPHHVNGISLAKHIRVSRSTLNLHHSTNGTTPSSTAALEVANATTTSNGITKNERKISHLTVSTSKDGAARVDGDDAITSLSINDNDADPLTPPRSVPQLELPDRSVLWNLLGRDELERVLPNGKLSIKIISWNRCSDTTVADAWNLTNSTNSVDNNAAESDDKLSEGDQANIPNEKTVSPQLSRRTFVIRSQSKSRITVDSSTATSPLPHCIVVSCQEFSFSTSFQQRWESALQNAIGLAHVKFFSDNVNGLHTVIFLQRELIWYTSVPRSRKIILRSLNTARSKALLSITFALFRTTLRFANGHFSAGETENQRRSRLEDHDELQKFVTINPIILSNNVNQPVLSRQKSTPTETTTTKPVTLRDGFHDVDYAFCYGDLNFRLNQQRHIVLETIAHIQRHEHYRQNVHNLLEWDDLKALMRAQRIFPHFSEPQIEFAPTYKYDLNTDTYDTSNKQRCPAFCDRILFRCNNKDNNNEPNSILCQEYSRIDNVRSSDHRPVYASFIVNIKPVSDDDEENDEMTASLYRNYSAGLFDRQLYATNVRDMSLKQQQQTRALNGGRGGRRASTTIAARRFSNTDDAKRNKRDALRNKQQSVVASTKKRTGISTAFEQGNSSSSICVIQ